MTMLLALSNLHDRMCQATIPIVKESCVTSQWSQVGYVARFGGSLERVVSVINPSTYLNTQDADSLSRAKIWEFST